MDAIRGSLAFYPDQVEIQEVGDATRPEAVRETILHTDDGAGQSQREHWPPTTSDDARSRL